MARFCVRCGSEESEINPIIDGLCPRCFLEVYGVVRIVKPIEIIYCHRCGAVKYGQKWIQLDSPEEFYALVRDIAYRCIAPTREGVDIVALRMKPFELWASSTVIEVDAVIGRRASITQSIEIPIIWKKHLCPNCFKIAGKSYEAVVQLRFFNEDEYVKKLRDELEKMFRSDIVEIEDVKNGFDIKVVSVGIARRIVDIIRRRTKLVRVIESIGDEKRRRDGRKVGRLYISVRVLNVKPGDYVVVNKRAYTVDSVTDTHIVLRDSSGRVTKLSIRDFVKQFTR